VGFFVIQSINSNSETEKYSNGYSKEVTVYKSPTCGCCVKYIAYLRRNGFEVEVVTTNDMASVKNTYNIPSSMESCHTMVMADYFVEGHVPLEAVDKLLEEKPAIDGIALPAMPSGSPGMPGIKTEVFNIFSLTGGEYSSYIKL